jgi:hypothetical protein
MRKPTLNFIVDSLAFVGFVVLVSTGILMRYVIPPGQGHGRAIWGLGRHDWGTFHFWVAVFFLSTIAVHLFLHWKWLFHMIRGRKKSEIRSSKRLGIVFSALTVFLIIAFAPVFSPIQSTNEIDEHQGSATVSSQDETHLESKIVGSMTLTDVERVVNIPATYFIENLKLPQDVRMDLPLRELQRDYGFTMDDVRTLEAAFRGE